MNEISLRRLKDVKVKGCFTIKCDSPERFTGVQHFFQTSSNKATFKALAQLQPPAHPEEVKAGGSDGYMRESTTGKRIYPFTIVFESLNELLKLREVFQIRASKFDTHLIEKRGYNPFTADFFDKLRDPTIYKIRK